MDPADAGRRRRARGLNFSRPFLLQDLADEAFAALLKKHGVPVDLKDALRRSLRAAKKQS